MTCLWVFSAILWGVGCWAEPGQGGIGVRERGLSLEKPAHTSGQVVIATPCCSQGLWRKTNPCMCICSSHWIRTGIMTPEVKGHSSNQLSHPSSALLARAPRLHLVCFAAHCIPACPRLFRRPGGSCRKGRSGWRPGIWICNMYTQLILIKVLL